MNLAEQKTDNGFSYEKNSCKYCFMGDRSPDSHTVGYFLFVPTVFLLGSILHQLKRWSVDGKHPQMV
jgi:hypothetical protein